ncbi:hypothetical protein SAMN04488118_105227 [Epibacterium ulvae]|uniref:Uncharacterized protein n=1 Tax=Epibacterium ulvae TaxID=1156985 RepID=A0A1G5QR32_9RHOB|nr:hypothetical protein [Epibacterium ulvae]SCZ64344.1 hypothetical protein SAMN04488118_105227 [Epibacterium ulvae]
MKHFTHTTRLSAFCLAAVVATTGVAPAGEPVFRAINSYHVIPLSDTLIEVIERHGDPNREEYWCAVGDYLRRHRVPWNTKVYVASEIQHSQVTGSRDAVVFSLDPDADGVPPLKSKSGYSGILDVGSERRVSNAFATCGRTPRLRF